MTVFEGGLWLLGLLGGTALVGATLYFVLSKVAYAVCVFVALVVRLGQTPAEAQGQPSWMALADGWYEKLPLVYK